MKFITAFLQWQSLKKGKHIHTQTYLFNVINAFDQCMWYDVFPVTGLTKKSRVTAMQFNKSHL